jgi:hypothetical protein
VALIDSDPAASRSRRGDGGPHLYASLAHLCALEHGARRFSFLPRQPSRSALNGRHASRVRGLDLEELRDHLPGDDIRSIDWKVTARTGAPTCACSPRSVTGRR